MMGIVSIPENGMDIDSTTFASDRPRMREAVTLELRARPPSVNLIHLL